MSIKRLNKNDITRGRIMDEIAEHFGNSVLGLYDKKLRIELIDDDGSVIQFSIAPVIHKDLVDPEECDEYIPTDEKIKVYEESLKKNAPKPAKKAKLTPPKKKASVKEEKERIAEVVSVAKEMVSGEFNFDEPVASKEETSRLEGLMSELGF